MELNAKLFGCIPNLPHNAIFLPQLYKVSHSNQVPHFGIAKRILSHFYKSLTGETKVVD
jgi:hypothetical protein